MTTLRPLSIARALVALAFATLAFAAPARANEIIVSTSNGMPVNNSISASDTITLTVDVVAPGISMTNNKQPLTFRSDAAASGVYRTITSSGASNRLFQFTTDQKTITFDHLILSGTNTGNAQAGAAINITGTAATPAPGAVTISGVFTLLNSVAGANGGAINAVRATVIFTDAVTFTGNQAGNQGGGLNIDNASSGTFMGAMTFTGNTAATNGGAANLANGSATNVFLASSTFINNTATNYGGAISAASTLIFTNGAYFSGNRSGANGGGAIYSSQNLTIAGNTLFENNTTGGNGGAILFTTAGANGHVLTLDATLGDITFRNNTSNTATATTPNAIALITSATLGTLPSLILNTGAGPAAHTIAFYDPITTANLDTTGGSAVIIQNGDGLTLLDSYASSVIATTTINSGQFRLANGATYGASDSVGDFTLATTATLSGDGAVQASAIALADGAQLNTTPGKTLTLRTAAFTGSSINLTGGGTLELLAASYAAPALNISGNGTISGNNTPITAALVDIGGPAQTATPQVLTFGATAPLTIADGGTLAFDLFAPGVSDQLNVSALTLSGSALINLTGGADGSYKLISAGNDLSAYAADFYTLMSGATFNLQNNNTELWLQILMLNTLTRWTGAGGGIWASSANSNFNWDNGSGVHTFINGDSVLFDDTAANRTVTIDPAGVNPGSMTVNNTAGNDYTFTGSGGITTSSTDAADPTAGKLIKQGAGALNFTNTGANTFTAGIELSAGTIGFTSGNQLNDSDANGIRAGIHATGDAALRSNASTSLSNNLKVDAGKTLTLDTAGNTLAYMGTLALDPTGTLAKTGAGVLNILSDNSSNTAPVLINEGVLALGSGYGKLGGDITLAATATLAGAGAATGTVNATPGSIIAPGALTPTAPATLTINNLNLDTATLRFNLFAADTSDSINLTGLLTTPNTAADTIDINAFKTGTYNLGNLASLATSGLPQVTIAGIAQTSGARQTATLAVAANTTDLLLKATADISRILTWTNAAATGTWNPSDANWTDHASTTLYANGDRVVFDTLPAVASATIAIVGNGVTVSDMQILGATNYAFTGAGITADPASIISGSVLSATAGTGKLLKAGTGTLALQNAANNFTGGIEIAAGAITFTDPAQLNTETNAINFTGNSKLATATPTVTLANAITIAANITGTIDAGANNITLSGPLAATGANATLAKIGAGALTLAAGSDDPNLALAIKEGALLISSGTVNIANLQLAATSTLAGAGTLTGAATLTGAVTASIATGTTLTFAGALNGPGGILKTGAGTLTFSNATLANTAPTQLDAGTLRLANYAPAAATLLTQTLLLNGGTLALGTGASTATGTNDATATNWAGLTLVQATSATASVITGGGNNLITLGSGTFAPQLAAGLHIVISATDGNNTVLLSNTANTFTGIVRVDSGTLQVTSAAPLGVSAANATKIALKGGAVQFTGTMNFIGDLELRAPVNTITTDPDTNVTWARITKVNSVITSATLVKVGSGTFTNSGAMQANALTIAEGRWIGMASSNATPSVASGVYGPVTVNENAVFQMSLAPAGGSSGTLGFIGKTPYIVTTNGTINNPFTGSGTLEIDASRLVLTSALTDIAHINITGTATAVAVQSPSFGPASTITVDQGQLVLAYGKQTLGNVVLKNGATLGFLMSGSMAAGVLTPVGVPARDATLASLTAINDKPGSENAIPNLWFNTNIAAGYADHLTVNAPVTGTFAINIANYGAAPARYTAALELIKAPLSASGTFIAATPELDIGLYKYTVATDTTPAGAISIAITGTGAMSTAVDSINAAAAALPLSWFSELDSVTQRLGELRFENRDAKAGPAVWVRGNAEKLNFNGKLTGAPFSQRHLSGEAGADWKIGGTASNVYLGAYIGYGRAERDRTAAGDASLDSTFAGAYATVSTKTGWYFDAAAKFNDLKTSLAAIGPTRETTDADYRNWAVGASLEAGKYCDIGDDWFLEPHAQVAFTNISGATYATDSGMTVTLNPASITRARAGLKVGRSIETDRHGTLHVYLSAHAGRQWTTNGDVTVATADGAQAARYACAIKGKTLEAGAGLAWLITPRTQLYFDYDTTQAHYYIKPYGLNLGVRYQW